MKRNETKRRETKAKNRKNKQRRDARAMGAEGGRVVVDRVRWRR